MKRIISSILILTMMICALLSAVSVRAATPDGEAIRSASDFAAMSASGKYYLANDITISSSYPSTFKGTLDGNGHVIRLAEGMNASPFNSTNMATIKNLIVEGVINILARKTYGGIVAEGSGYFENVIARVGISAMVEGSFVSVGASQGCFIGNANGECSFVNCTNESSITVITQSKGVAYAGFGGFIGTASTNNETISFVNCNNDAAITSFEPQICVGGFIGNTSNTNLSFSKCNNNAFIIGISETEGHSSSGGFVGTMSGGTLTVRTCHNFGEVQNNGSTGHTGGLIGRLSNVYRVDIDGFKNLRAVYNYSNYWEGVGGVIGVMSDVSRGSAGTYIFKNCMSCGSVTGSMAGGVVGLDQSAHGIDITFERCINTNSVTTLGYAYSGGILGRSNSELRGLRFNQCFNAGTVTANTSDSWGVGGICGNLGEDGHGYNFSPVFENCINLGAINCKSWSDAVSAAGILSRNIYTTTTIKNCFNLGTLSNASHSANVAPIAPKVASTSFNVSGCAYLSGTGNAAWGESAKSVSEMSADIAAALTRGLLAESEYCNYRNSDSDVNSVGEGVDKILSAESIADIKQGCLAIYDHVTSLVRVSDKRAELLSELGEPLSNANGKYTEESYSAYITEYEKIKSDINSATTDELLTIDLSARKASAEALLVLTADMFSAKKAELLAALGEKIYNDDGKYTLDSYEAYSDAYLAIKAIIDNASDMSILNILDVSILKSAAESKLVLDTTPDPEPPITDETDAPESESATETEAPSGKKCGSSVAISALAIVGIMGAALVLKKKD